VLGANLGSGVLGLLATSRASPQVRRLPLGNLTFKILGALLVIPFLPQLLIQLQQWAGPVHHQVVVFHLAFNLSLALLFVGFTGVLGRRVDRWLPELASDPNSLKPRHLDPVALATPSLAISCAAREGLRQADVVETMLRGMLSVIRNNDLALAERLRDMDDTVDELYTAIKLYLTQISREALSERESRRWTDVVSFTINMEQIGDIIERVLQDVEDKKVRKNRSFSDAGMSEICNLHELLLANLRLAMSVFLQGDVKEAQKLLEEKARFRVLEHQYAASHIGRLRDNTAQSIETSSLHLDLPHLLDRLPDPRVCRRVARKPDPPLAAGDAARRPRLRFQPAPGAARIKTSPGAAARRKVSPPLRA
jgi:phosphate:Na+ symporter